MNFDKLKKHLCHPQNLLYWFICRHPEWVKDDKTYLKMRYALSLGRKLNLDNPQTYSEKLQWLKLYDRRPEYTKMVDKYAAKDYVANKVGQEYVVPTYGVWDKVEDIEWEKLPKQFVLKTTHDSGGIVICRDKETLDKEAAISKLRIGLAQDFYYVGREWPYKNVPHRIIAEKYLEPRPDTHDLPDYKFFCFDGEVKAMFIATDRGKKGEQVKFDYFTPDFEPLPFKQSHPHASKMPEKPKNFGLMKEIASKLSQGLPHVRVDLYEVEEKVFFGELTLYHFSGFAPFHPDEWDKVFGDMLTLPGEKLGGVIIKTSDSGSIAISPVDLPDYKFFCFGGKAQYCQVIQGRSSGSITADFFDRRWRHQTFHEPRHIPHAVTCPEPPACIHEMWTVADKLSEGVPFIRVDLYCVNNKIYVGELTFYPTSGYGGFDPDMWDLRFGKMIVLPDNK